MQTMIATKFFPESRAAVVHQTGRQLTAATRGVGVVLHTREGESAPCCAEVISGQHHAEIGLWFDGTRLVDYDGAFFLPREVGRLLTEAGYIVAEEFFE